MCRVQPAVTQLQECPNDVTAVAEVGFDVADIKVRLSL